MDANKPTVGVTRPLPPQVEQRVREAYVVRMAKDPGAASGEALLALADGADALLASTGDRLDCEFFEHVAASVRIVAVRAVGYDGIDIAAAARRGIVVSNTPGVLTDAVADGALLLLLGASRRAYEAQQFLRRGEWSDGQPSALLGRQLTGKVLGIYGMGRIGRATASRAKALGMKIHYSNRSKLADDLADGAVFHEDPDDLLRLSEFLSLHAPATPQTRHFLNTRTLALLPAGAIVVNTARGELISDDDLLAALADGTVGAVGLDVFEHEPEIDSRYMTLTNAFLMPHLAAATIETQLAIAELALDNVDAVLKGRSALTPLTA